MLTARGWWLLAVGLAAAVLGLLVTNNSSTTLPILGLTLLAWVLVSWVVFAARSLAAVSNLDITRALVQGGRESTTAWAKAPCRVRVSLALRGGSASPFMFATDRPAADAPTPQGESTFAGTLHPDRPAVIEYDLRPDGPGVLRFEGMALKFTDLNGFFYRRAFVRLPVEYLVLPPLGDDEGHQRANKRFNTLPPPGVHRLRRPGGGGDLLDLRDYRPGDPPKMIAWKASARRDRLITKEYETDVPVRCTLFLDCGQAVRVGPANAAPVVKLAEVAAAVAQAAAGNRDLVGLATFDEETAAVLRPARTTVHTVHLLGKLAEAAGLLPARVPGSADALLARAHPLAEELYPDLLAADVNSRPAGMYWLPLLDTRWGWLVFLPLALSPMLLTQASWFNWAVERANRMRPQTPSLPANVALFVILLAGVILLPTTAALMVWVLYGVRGFFEPRRTRTRRRKQLGLVFAGLDGDSPAAVERYLRDDAAFAEWAGRFLAAHRVRVPPSPYLPPPPVDGGKLAVLAAALLRSVAVARDNELFVILADLTDAADDAGEFLRAVKVARGRHHQVLVVIPWAAGVPAPAGAVTPRRPVAEPAAARLRVPQVVQAGLIRQYQRRYETLRTDLARVGAVLVRAEGDAAARVILARLDRLRGARTRR